jgi:uracil DNA glycosylase
MSSKINSKDIINKQKEKYAQSAWAPFLNQEFDKPEFAKFLDKLIDNVGNGKPFSPAIKDWFNDLQSVSIDNLKVIIISSDEITIQKKEELNQQGVLLYSLGRTKTENKLQLEEWRMFNIFFIDYLISNKKDIVYVFVGDYAHQFADLICEDEYGPKVLLPHQAHPIWGTHLLNDLTNALLKSRELMPIVW